MKNCLKEEEMELVPIATALLEAILDNDEDSVGNARKFIKAYNDRVHKKEATMDILCEIKRQTEEREEAAVHGARKSIKIERKRQHDLVKRLMREFRFTVGGRKVIDEKVTSFFYLYLEREEAKLLDCYQHLISAVVDIEL